MIAPNDKHPGRNDPCPCGSEVKYKLCCGDEDIKRIRHENVRMRVLAHMFLTQIQQATGAPVVIVAEEVIRDYPHDCEIKMIRDKAQGVFAFTAKPESEIEAPTKLVLPKSRVL